MERTFQTLFCICMSAPLLTPVFANAAGELLRHPAGYAVLRYKAGSWGQPELIGLLTNATALLMTQNWHRFFVDSRLIPELPSESKNWVSPNWLSSLLPRTTCLHIALVASTSMVVRAATSKMRAQAPANVHYIYFAEEAAAHAFLAGLAE